MRISELADAADVPLATVKFYLREGLLMPGTATSRTRAEYGESHLERLRLVRALVVSGGLGIKEVRAVVQALEEPPDSPHHLLGVAHRALPPPVEPAEATEEVLDWLRDLGWDVCLESPLVGSLARAMADARAAGIPLAAPEMAAYAEAARRVARADVDVATTAPAPAAALRTVVVGTVLVDPVLATLRRLAQVVESAARSGH